MKRRRMQSDELELWRKVARSTTPLWPNQSESQETPPVNFAEDTKPQYHIEKFEVGSKSKGPTPPRDVFSGLAQKPSSTSNQMDKKAFGRLKRGKLVPEARIDLHGMTLNQAQPALTGFIMCAQAKNKRLVLVITGKGKDRDDSGPIPVRRGVLRHNVPHWLSIPPLAQLVLQVSEAHLKHGGGGAFYVYLRRQR